MSVNPFCNFTGAPGLAEAGRRVVSEMEGERRDPIFIASRFLSSESLKEASAKEGIELKSLEADCGRRCILDRAL